MRSRGNGRVVEQRLYQLVRQPQPIIDRQFEIEFLDAGVEAFSFTFACHTTAKARDYVFTEYGKR